MMDEGSRCWCCQPGCPGASRCVFRFLGSSAGEFHMGLSGLHCSGVSPLSEDVCFYTPQGDMWRKAWCGCTGAVLWTDNGLAPISEEVEGWRPVWWNCFFPNVSKIMQVAVLNEFLLAHCCENWMINNPEYFSCLVKTQQTDDDLPS